MQNHFSQYTPVPPRSRERGASLIMVMIILTIVSMLGIAGIQLSINSERGARNDRDIQLAWQGAEAGLIDAEFDIFGPVASSRRAIFTPTTNLQAFVAGCGTLGNSNGLCSVATTGRPAWVDVNFDTNGSAAQTTAFGTFTGRTFAAGGPGVQPARAPRYVIEPIRDPNDRDLGNPNPAYVYRVTAMGFGTRADIQAVVQMIYRN
ncbi:MAG: PilX N-terminal domain-containing pilus assembly protein [Burkholderiaceae bacterium]